MSLLDAWDDQQARYIAAREERFDAMLTVVEWLATESENRHPVVVDLGAGPAAIGRRLLRRLPTASYVGIDIDLVLLRLGRRLADEFDPGRLHMVDGDVADPAWLNSVGVGAVDVVCSSTALHWLPADGLRRCLRNAYQALRPGGVLLNADHLGYDEQAPSLTALAEWVAARDERAAADRGALSWDDWWTRARADDELTPQMEQRDHILGSPAVADEDDDHDDNDNDEDEDAASEPRPPLRQFLELARSTGFSEVETVWQRFDDRIVLAVKPGPPTP
ncbi:MAG: class I SAM-dependent methyltransferase [Actinomycetota bacterium]